MPNLFDWSMCSDQILWLEQYWIESLHKIVEFMLAQVHTVSSNCKFPIRMNKCKGPHCGCVKQLYILTWTLQWECEFWRFHGHALREKAGILPVPNQPLASHGHLWAHGCRNGQISSKSMPCISSSLKRSCCAGFMCLCGTSSCPLSPITRSCLMSGNWPWVK